MLYLPFAVECAEKDGTCDNNCAENNPDLELVPGGRRNFCGDDDYDCCRKKTK